MSPTTGRRSSSWRGFRADAASDRQAMLDSAERIRKDGEADRRAMLALVESSERGVA